MTACEDKRLLLNALIDGELDAANAVALEDHLAACAGCAEAVARYRAVRAGVAQTGVAHVAPDALRRRLAAAVAPGTGARPPRRGRAPWLVVPAATALAAVLAALVFVPPMLERPLAEDLVADHVRSMLASHLVDVATSDRHVVKPWFDGKVAFAPTVIDFAPQGFPLVGGRLDWAGGERAAALVYRRGGHIINVFVRPAAGPEPRDLSLEGYHLVHWRAGGLDYWAVSDVETAELRRLRSIFLAAGK